MKKKLLIVIIIVATSIIILNYQYFKSVLVMYFYSQYHQENSIMEKKDFNITIPGGLETKEKDWYPFVMIFNDEQFPKIVNKRINLTVLYNFGAFNGKRSSFYDARSDYFSAFYGAYVIESMDDDYIYGLENGRINEEELDKLAKYDLSQLVLNSIGCPYNDINFNIEEMVEYKQYLTYSDWIKVDTTVKSRSPLHSYKTNYAAYTQYGKPPKNIDEKDYQKIELVGRMYCRYFKEYQSTILLYIIAPNVKVLNETDEKILSKIQIK